MKFLILAYKINTFKLNKNKLFIASYTIIFLLFN